MKNRLIIAIAVLLAAGLSEAHAQQNADSNYGIIPAPKQIVSTGEDFVICPDDKVVIYCASEQVSASADYLRQMLAEEFGTDALISEKKPGRKAKSIVICNDSEAPQEGYTLAVSADAVSLKGSRTGLFYAIQSLRQMMRTSSGDGGPLVVPGVLIEDEPRFRYRGIMQDVGYHIYPVDFIKRQIDYLSRYKMNVYHWHLTEDHGWRIESLKYPKLNEVASWREQTCISHYDGKFSGMDATPYGGYYTQEEIRDIVAYAAERHVTVIPEIELPGHTLAVLAAYPELACNKGPFKVAQTWGIYDDVFCAGKEEVFTFLEDVLTEVMDLFPSEYIHIGGDECPKDRWRRCPLCQERIRKEGLRDEYELQSYFIKRIEKFINSKGRKIIGWDEILEGGLAQNATVMNWRDTTEGVKAVKQGHDVIMSPNAYLYFDYIQGDRKQEPLAIGWGFNPAERVYAYEPVPEGISPDAEKHIIGVESPLWTEHMDTYRKVEYMLFPRLMALAELAWTPKERKDSRNFFEDRLPVHLGWLDRTDIVYRVPEPMGMKDEILYGSDFVLELKSPVEGAKIYYNFDGQAPRETDYLYEGPVKIHVHEGEMREVKALVITPSGKRSNYVRTVYDNRARTDFMVGSASASLEPDLSIFSLTLAGYGAPAEGRFSLAWDKIGSCSDFVWMAGGTDALYGVDAQGGLHKMCMSDNEIQTVVSDMQVRYLAVDRDVFYAVSEDGRLYRADGASELKWTELSASGVDGICSLTAGAGKIYAATDDGRLLKGELSGNEVRWKDVGHAQTVIGMAFHEGFLYALTANQKLWKRSASALDADWTQIGYNNGETYRIDLRQIAVTGDRLIAIGTDGNLYANVHSTNSNLTAEATAFSKGGKTAIVIGADLTGFDFAFINEVKAAITEETGVESDAIMINASHTHFAPVSQYWLAWHEPHQRPDWKYMSTVVKPALVSVARQAKENMKPSKIYFGRTRTDIGGNRALSGKDAVYDSAVDVVQVFGQDNTLENVIFTAACHPVFNNSGAEGYTLNGNFPSYAKSQVRNMTGTVSSQFMQGCGGDVNPRFGDFRHMGQILADDVVDRMKREFHPVSGEISCSLDSVLVPIHPWKPEKIREFRAQNEPYMWSVEHAKNVRWADIMLDKYARNAMPEYMPVYYQIINIGNWKIVGLSREAVSRYGVEIRKLWPDKFVTVLGYTNDVSSYLPAGEHVNARTYEGENSFFWYSQPDRFPADILDIVVNDMAGK